MSCVAGGIVVIVVTEKTLSCIGKYAWLLLLYDYHDNHDNNNTL